jgi:hypothetical protein
MASLPQRMQFVRGCETECDITMPQLHSTTGTLTLLFARPNRPTLSLPSLCLRQNATQENGQNRGEVLPRIARPGVKTLLRGDPSIALRVPTPPAA